MTSEFGELVWGTKPHWDFKPALQGETAEEKEEREILELEHMRAMAASIKELAAGSWLP